MIADDYGYNDVPERLSRTQLLRVLKLHDACPNEFDADHALADAYDADAVLSWLGY